MKIFAKIFIIIFIFLVTSQLLFSDSKSDNNKGINKQSEGMEVIYTSVALKAPGTAKSGRNGRIAVNYDPYWTIKGIITEGIGVGVGFEVAFLSFLAFKINSMYLAIPQKIIGINYVLSIINLSGGVRVFYLATGANGPFIGTHGGIFIVCANISSYEVTIPVIPMFIVETGYKWNFMQGHGFFLEPSVGFIFTDPVVDIKNSTSLGGMYITINIGWVF